MQNKARLELADYEAVSEEGLLVSALLSICALPVLALLSYLLGHTDSNNICFSMCHCIICSSLSTKLLNESLVQSLSASFSFISEQESLKIVSSCALYTACAINIISLDSYKAQFSCFFFVLLTGELSKATESFRQEMGVHFYASRSTSKVGFYKNHTRIEPL